MADPDAVDKVGQGTTGGGGDDKIKVGTPIVYRGQPWKVVSTDDGVRIKPSNKAAADALGYGLNTNIKIDGGNYQLPGTNTQLTISGDGTIIQQGGVPDTPKGAVAGYETDVGGFWWRVFEDGSRDQLQQWEVKALGLGTGSGDGGGGGSSTPYGYTAPDPQGALSAIFKRYEYEMLDANRPREEAQQNFDNALNAFEALQRGEINYAQFLQNAAISEGQLTQGRDSQLIDIAKAQEEGTRAREIANQSSKLQIADMRRQMGTDFMRDAMPKALPSNVTGIQIPGLGGGFNMPTMQYSPDQVYGIDALNQVPTVNPNVGAFPTPSPVAPIPVPTLTAPPAILNQPLPTAQMPQIPNVQSIIDQMLNGSGPMGWA